jgi:hypothetical protein
MAPPVGRRGHNPFKQKDVVRTMRSARAGGMESIDCVEVTTKDGTTIRVFGKGASSAVQDTPEKIIERL